MRVNTINSKTGGQTPMLASPQSSMKSSKKEEDLTAITSTPIELMQRLLSNL